MPLVKLFSSFDSLRLSLRIAETQMLFWQDKIDHELVDHQVICGVCPPRTHSRRQKVAGIRHRVEKV